MRFILPVTLSVIVAGWVLSSAPGAAACRSAYDAAGRAAINKQRRGVPMAPALKALERACR
jgi:hypothetical protein